VVRFTHRHPGDGVGAGVVELAGAAQIGGKGGDVALELGVPHRERLG
jgi:hypothetical protein